ncbi:hypothetical protein NRA01_16925 [Acinetobacter baumannii]|uniref:hypothetical protein n=1 Tax=Acinetobacter baumannii TaxID=470 RepID=UPI0010579BCF|nr:hypothetical protein [Acinetobacter baumannii]MDC4422671.1 hypothetical protein [Acinetobacter baumannii]MDC4854112.1 hypothetical protein [Acinetobacter baumannii]MDC4959279.1 hypothetical protein [Acinetobacter baumannii]MDC4983852.1 hypothetical protein [Acinetobacter baumannii]MDN8226990.1 hypothetical protein [Acinetobacter baumannii]
MKKLFLGLGLTILSISTHALDLQTHEVPAYLIEQQGYSGQVNCTYRGVLKSGVQRTFKASMFNECEQVVALSSVGPSAYTTVARIPHTTNSTFVNFIGVKPRKYGGIYVPGRSDSCHPSLSYIPQAVADCKNKRRGQ